MDLSKTTITRLAGWRLPAERRITQISTVVGRGLSVKRWSDVRDGVRGKKLTSHKSLGRDNNFSTEKKNLRKRFALTSDTALGRYGRSRQTGENMADDFVGALKIAGRRRTRRNEQGRRPPTRKRGRRRISR